MSSQESDGGSTAPGGPVKKDSPKHCSACGLLVKEHAGPHGKGRCLLGLLKDLQTRVCSLESDLATQANAHAEEFMRLGALHEQRVDGLLATVVELQEQVHELRSSS